jgi:hypothetical protein
MTGSRSLSSTNITASSATNIVPVIFAKLELDSGNILLHTGLGDLSFGGDTYTGAGSLAGISAAEEISDLSRTPISLTLAGIPNTIIAVMLGSDQHYQGRRATLYLGYLDLTARTLLDTPFIMYRGNIDNANIQQDKNCTITLSVESRFAAWDQPNIRRYNNDSQQLRYPGDTGFEFVEQATDKQIFWGGQAQ